MSDDLELRILRRLVRRGATREHLHNGLSISAEVVAPALTVLENKGWISRGFAWHDPGDMMEILLATHAGRQELARYSRMRGDAPGDEPIEVSREDLIAELERRGFASRQRLEIDPALRASRFHFWPSIPAYSSTQED